MDDDKLGGCPYHGSASAPPKTLLSPEALLNPFDIYRQLRSEHPVAYIADQNIWVISRYDDCRFVLDHPEKFSSREAVSSTNAYRRSPQALEILRQSRAAPRAQTLIMSDPPEHDRYRDILQRALAPVRAVRVLTPKMQSIIDELIDGFCERGACEFVREFAYPLPMRVVAAILDVADDQIDMLKAWSDDFISVQAGNIPEHRIVSAAQHTIEFENFVLAKMEDRRREPKDDFLGRLVNQPDGEGKLSLPEFVNICLQILVGGNESTTNFLGNALFTLLSREEPVTELLRDDDRTANLIEEILRFESPLQGLFRVAREDHSFDGTLVPKGAKLMLCFGSANRDEKYYGDGAFQPDRDYRRTAHLAFGQGIHACAGQAFARREGLLAIRTLFARLPNLRLAPNAPNVPQMLFTLRGMRELHLEFDPSPRSIV